MTHDAARDKRRRRRSLRLFLFAASIRPFEGAGRAAGRRERRRGRSADRSARGARGARHDRRPDRPRERGRRRGARRPHDRRERDRDRARRRGAARALAEADNRDCKADDHQRAGQGHPQGERASRPDVEAARGDIHRPVRAGQGAAGVLGRSTVEVALVRRRPALGPPLRRGRAPRGRPVRGRRAQVTRASFQRRVALADAPVRGGRTFADDLGDWRRALVDDLVERGRAPAGVLGRRLDQGGGREPAPFVERR
jgi:hypothetical protein